MDYNKAALEMHESHHGKVGIVSKVEVKTRDDLSTAYTPGVAEPCRKIKENPEDVYSTPSRATWWQSSPTAPLCWAWATSAPRPVCPLWRARPCSLRNLAGWTPSICIDAHDAASVIAACKAIAPTFGGINLEDIKSPECFEIERR